MKTDVVLLPGLHGSVSLFEAFVALAPPWANCRSIELPATGEQTFDSIADRLELHLRPLEGFVLFAESFAAPIAARLAHRLAQKIALLVLCNPLIELSLGLFPPVVPSLLRLGAASTFVVATAMTGGDRILARSILREVRRIPREVLVRRVAAACSATREDLVSHLSAPLLIIVGNS